MRTGRAVERALPERWQWREDEHIGWRRNNRDECQRFGAYLGLPFATFHFVSDSYWITNRFNCSSILEARATSPMVYIQVQ